LKLLKISKVFHFNMRRENLSWERMMKQNAINGYFLSIS